MTVRIKAMFNYNIIYNIVYNITVIYLEMTNCDSEMSQMYIHVQLKAVYCEILNSNEELNFFFLFIPRREHTDPPVSAVRPEPELTTPVKEAESVHRQPSVKSSCGVKDMTAFLKKLREAVQPKPAG